jgi:iron(III) transport system substrate-binding protein
MISTESRSNSIVRFLRCTIALLAALLLAATALGQGTEDLDSLIEAAKQEGTLTLYSGFTDADNKKAAELFQDKYGIEVQIFRANTNDVLARFDLEVQAGNVNADVLALADPFASAQLQQRDLLLEFTPPSAQERAFDDRFSGSHYQIAALTIWPAAWNTERVDPGNQPQDFEDFLDPFWKGRLGMLDASTSLVGIQYYYLLREAMGVEFMEKLGAQDFTFISPNNAIAERIVSGEIYGAPLLILNVAEQFIQQGAPLEVDYMPSGTPVLARTIQVVREAKHPNAAKLFVNFLLSQEGQQGFQETARAVSPRTDVSVEGVPSLADVNALTIKSVEEFLQSVDDLRAEFESFFKSL